MTHWIDPQPADVRALAPLEVPELIAHILARRGIQDAATARAFLHPDSIPSTPFPGIEKAVDRLLLAIRREEAVCIWGDFDVDGQTSTALLIQALQAAGLHPSHHIPIRATEGHGIQLQALQEVLASGVKLVLTCDTGISAHEAVQFARGRGVEFLITDHHDIVSTVPDAYCVVNPKLLPDDHPLATLSGVGVAYKLAEALLSATQAAPVALLDLVALGLIADLALLKGEARALVHKGLRELRETRRLGLRLLGERAKIDLPTLTEETIGFALAPRLNAVGRLDDANAAVELLLTRDAIRARVLAAQIETLNTQRKLLTEQVYQAAEEQLHADPSFLAKPILVLMHPSWSGGVLGIVAARLVERYRKPAILLSSSTDDVLRGSARSVEGLDITQAIAACEEFLLGFGGHPMAAGLSLTSAKLAEFRRSIEGTVSSRLGIPAEAENRLEIDYWMELGGLSLELADQIEQLAPFGPGNPVPVLASRGVTLKASRQFGLMQEHWRLLVADERGNSQEILWWNGGGEPEPRGVFDIAYTIRASTFRGERLVAAEMRDFRVVHEPSIEVAAGPEVFDHRGAASLAPLPSGCLIWAEAAEASKGTDRYHLRASDELAILSPPPGRDELRAALSLVRPRKVYLVTPAAAKPESAREFLERLAGLVKYAVGHYEGRTSVTKLAAACAQRELTVRLGLEWLAASGHAGVEVTQDDVLVGGGSGIANPILQNELFASIGGLVEETAAYRSHFAIADAQTLL